MKDSFATAVTEELQRAGRGKDAKFLGNISRLMSKPRKNLASVNLAKLDRITKKGEVVVVPGKLLGTGLLAHKLEIYSFGASKAAVEGVEKAGGSISPILELVKKHPKGTGVRIIK
ncbi:MAG: 50S ribosomal protein L18e [Euryarchaeota archaeon]|jgi:large subunit ribosomal protein L18e|nr:50S ribosomal protein L18e [Euryarchaeota archaeon]|tara:strand:- start:53767 stop:54114 length:348 start_codon:yes stop_codon:yes gene_type:complete